MPKKGISGLKQKYIYFLIGVNSKQGWTATMRHKLQEKEAQKGESIQEICLERTYSQQVFVNSRLKGYLG